MVCSTVVCMEDSCFQEIPLDPHPTVPGGGVERGFGCLLTFWVSRLTSSPPFAVD